ncbi:MAG TPA: response regulator, partial [Tepidisphaeraceae bacterium]|nr:response regulator [Tepidisphaeraceae bacterium]
HPDNSYSSTLKDISSFAPVRFVLQGNHGAIRFEDERGVAWHAYGWPVGNGWSAVTLEPENEVLAQASLIQRIASGVALCAIALVAALISLASRTVLRPIHNLTEAARGLANGDWKSRAPENRADELGILARTFNSMAGQLEQGYRHVEQEVARRTAELTRNNVELREARHAAEAANRAKDQFLANMSHEIRTPMTAILGYTEVLETNPPAAEREDAMQIIHRNGEQLLAIINNILDLSKIHADGLSISKVDFDLSAWTNELVAQMQPRAEKKGLKLETIFDESIPARIHSDPLRLRQILTNLADNAIKFTDAAGLVTIRVSCNAVTRNGAEASDVRFEVSDSGLGMSGEQVARLFKPFTQVDNSMTRRHGGTGLGLSISKRLAEMLGGELSVDSQLGRGSTFRLIVDGGAIQQLQKSPANSSAQPIQPIHLKGKILLAEDGADNQRLISQFLRNAGAEVIIAENGKIALGLAQSQHFDLILMDMQMPEIDGYDATRQLRRSGCNLPIVALTAHAMADDRSKCLAAGCDDYLSKPINKTTLLTSVARHIDSDAPALRIKRAS